MKIKRITSQHRRDFTAVIVCEGCQHEQELKGGYDDRNYHDNVLPNFKCKKCEKSRNDLGIVDEQVSTKYPDWMQV
jgi:transposase-like protein